MDGFVETRAMIGNKISDETGNGPKTICDRMSVMSENICLHTTK